MLIILFSKIPEPELAEAAAEKPEKTGEVIKGALSFRHFVFGAIAIFLYVGVEVGIPNFVNLYMTSPAIGIAAGVAGTIVGMYWFLMLCGRLVGASVGGKVSSKAMMTTVIWVRVDTLPEMRVLPKRPTIIRSQYTAAMAPPMAAPFTAIPAPFSEASARKKFTWAGIPISIPT